MSTNVSANPGNIMHNDLVQISVSYECACALHSYLYAHFYCVLCVFYTLQWCHNWRDGVSNYQLYSTVYSGADQRNIKARVTGLCVGNSPVTGEFPHKWPVTRKMFPFDDVIMNIWRELSRPFHTLRSRQNGRYLTDDILKCMLWRPIICI